MSFLLYLQPWRLITYMLVHSGYIHISSNIIVQLLLGLPLEIGLISH